MAFEDVLVHTAVPLEVGEGTYVEGHFVPGEPEPGNPFACVLFLPDPSSEDASPQVIYGRRIVQPTLLYSPRRLLPPAPAEMVALAPEDEVDVTAPEINVAEGREAGAALRWQVAGRPQPFGRPGDEPVGFQVTLRRVEE